MEHNMNSTVAGIAQSFSQSRHLLFFCGKVQMKSWSIHLELISFMIRNFYHDLFDQGLAGNPHDDLPLTKGKTKTIF